MIYFQNPIRIVFSCLLIGLIVFVQNKYPIVLPFLHTKLAKQSAPSNFLSTSIRFSFIVLPYVIVFLFSLLLAWPNLVSKEVMEQKQARQLVIALDVSLSMQADDLPPNRIEFAKTIITKILDQFVWDKIGLVLFAWKPLVSIPLSSDIHAIKTIMTQYSSEVFDQKKLNNQGSAIGDAILASLNLLERPSSWAEWSAAKWSRRIFSNNEISNPQSVNPQSVNSQFVILITDGSTTLWTDPLIASNLAASSWISIYTIWIWSEQGWSIGLPWAFGTHKLAIEGVDTKTLSQIAKVSWWKYTRLSDRNWFDQVLSNIASIYPSTVEIVTINFYSSLETYIVFIIGILIVILFYLMTKYR